MKIFWAIGLLLGLTLGACQSKNSSEKRIEEISTDGSVSDIIRSPVSADGKLDTSRVAKMTFVEKEYNFGEVTEGAVVEYIFKFKNTGKVPLIISDVRSTCGCTVPEWSKVPIAPGEGSEIKVRFDTTGKLDAQQKPVTITANTYPSETVVYVAGFVRDRTM